MPSSRNDRPDEAAGRPVRRSPRGTRGEGVRGTVADAAMDGRDPERTSAEMTQERIERGRADDRLDEILGPDLERDGDVER